MVAISICSSVRLFVGFVDGVSIGTRVGLALDVSIQSSGGVSDDGTLIGLSDGVLVGLSPGVLVEAVDGT